MSDEGALAEGRRRIEETMHQNDLDFSAGMEHYRQNVRMLDERRERAKERYEMERQESHSVQDEFDHVQPASWNGEGEYRMKPRRKVWLVFEIQRYCTCDSDRYNDVHSHRRLAWPWRKTWDRHFFPTFREYRP